ncbi:MAG: tryptophan 7-halogenase [Myxococcales bacterium]|nr:tryptophan 7-halogenase [Myxococcales bacterium]MCB9717589.1 tryptophan 7-halogenase [Myxococcales bacterium]
MTEDVLIIGGGLAGSTLAIQLKQRMPSLSVTVLERQRFPVPEAAHKVGESSVEVGAHYFNHVLGLSHALIPAKIPKLGLRYFFPAGDNARIEVRPELGQTHYHSVLSTQFDRGRQENILVEQCRGHGVRVLDGARVSAVEVAAGGEHAVAFEHEGRVQRGRARWLVDASGRRSLLKRELGLAEANEHRVNASWWRIDEPLAVDALGHEPAWQRRVPFGMRRLSTNHFMGEGYWVWLIPLASGAISIGIVADGDLHPVDEINTLERARRWLVRHEPQIDALMGPHLDQLKDFRTLKHFSYGATQVYSGQRWALTGEAGVFVDPFYSPGSDFIAMSNGFVTALVEADQRGGDVEALARAYDRQYLALYRSFLLLYQGQYELFGNAQVMSLKVIWDYSGYWGSTALLYFQGKLHDPEFMKKVSIDAIQVFRLSESVQGFLRQWHRLDPGTWAEPAMLNYQRLGYLSEWQAWLVRDYDEATLRRALRENRKVLELVAAWLYRRATGSERAVDPYRLSLSAADVVQPPRRLDMLEELDAHVDEHTELRDGIRVVLEPTRSAKAG